ncbi:hypothetical protein JL722_12193 [Aureococcus anophagefferens]|nr:hypothetical protein JL722_12193 [Aureococcus anophagefferens]
MLRRIKKFTVYSSAIVVGQASRALDNAPFAGQDESEDAKNLLRRLSDGVSVCDDKEEPYHALRTNQFWKFFDYCIDLDETELRVPPANLYSSYITGTIPTEIGLLSALTYLRVPRPDAGAARAPSRLWECGITGPIPTEIGQLTALTELRVPPRPDPGEARDRPRRRRYLTNTKITGTLPVEFGQLTKLTYLRVPPASPTPGAPRDRPSASQRGEYDQTRRDAEPRV